MSKDQLTHNGKPDQPEKPWRLPLRVVNQEPGPLVYRILVHLVRLVAPLLTKRSWAGQQYIPRKGGVLVVCNHISNYDVLVLGEYLIWSGRWARFMGKAEIWKVPGLGWIARKAGQIPVLRNTPNAKDSLIHAEKALRDGQMVAIYPEGTITCDPDGWPMTSHHGAAQLALATGVPVIPVGQTGAEQVLGGRFLRFHKLFSWRRRSVKVLAGPPIDLAKFQTEAEPSRQTLDQVSTIIMDAITDLVAQLRGEPAPIDRWDRRQDKRVPQNRSAEAAE